MSAVADDYVTVAGDEGEAIWYAGGLVTVKLSGAKTGGTFALVDELVPRGMQAPLHVHTHEDETFVVIDGVLRFTLGEREIEAAAGSNVFLPRGLPHAFRVESETAHVLNLITPSGFEAFFRRLGEPARSRTLPPPSDRRPDLGELRGVAGEFGVEILL